MFLDFFGLREQPFGVTPNPRFLYLSDSHREVLASLLYAILFTLLPIPFVFHSVFAAGPIAEFAIFWIVAAWIWLGYFRQRPC